MSITNTIKITDGTGFVMSSNTNSTNYNSINWSNTITSSTGSTTIHIPIGTYTISSPIKYTSGTYSLPYSDIKINPYTGDPLSYDMDWMSYGRTIRVGDIVKTPLGRGLVYLIEEEIYCIELDPTSNILHEFTIDEIEKDG